MILREGGITDEAYNALVAGAAKQANYTRMFHTFIFMHLFNEFNCRKIEPKEFNMFASLFSNFYFIFIILGCMAI